ncbi:HTTM domain-containing protein [uncultured Gimesia sp.]|uniref:HTTM domain-containing protein n=1 Tax=uncultured Gimesia sp. TaxID=1678688 RepID=UPI0030DA814C|tara:strand:+ start:79169 stop:80683 length:1515 start_codon:yes stop_codon:yes gene_type:complete
MIDPKTDIMEFGSPSEQTGIPASRLESLSRWLFQPVDIAPLVFFRIFFGLMMLYHIWAMTRDRWVQYFYIDPDFHFSYPGWSWIEPWPGIGMHIHFGILMVAAVGISLGLYYRFSALTFFLGYSYVFLLEKSLYQNHCYLICLLSGIMVLLPAHRACSLDRFLWRIKGSQVMPQWTLWLLRFQIAIPYFYGGIAKLNFDWLHTQPIGMWVQRRTDVPFLGAYLEEAWVPWFFAYGGLLFDLLIVPALMWRRTRLLAYMISIGFHLTNSILWEIGIFPWFMIGASLLFFPPSSFRKAAHLSKLEIASQDAPLRFGWGQRMTVITLCVYISWQLIFPFRHFLYPGNVSWNEEGHHFSWHMMLREKNVGIRFYAYDPATNQRGLIKVEEFLNSRQLSRMGKDPDMVLEFVHYVRDHYREHRNTELEIYVLNIASLNGRKPQLLMDPKLNYAVVDRVWTPQPWVVPLTESLPEESWNMPLDQWEKVLDLDIPKRMQLARVQQPPRQIP